MSESEEVIHLDYYRHPMDRYLSGMMTACGTMLEPVSLDPSKVTCEKCLNTISVGRQMTTKGVRES